MKALFSVFDKEGIEELAETLVQKGYSIYATRGTKKYLEEKGINSYGLEELGVETEGLLRGKIKTLHPIIFEKILGEETFDLLVVNLYPFEEQVKKNVSEDEILENIDIGGVALIRAGVKNYRSVGIVVDKEDYKTVVEEIEKNGKISEKIRRKLAYKAISYTSFYDAKIAEYFKNQDLNKFIFAERKIMDLRYGENPHQKASLYGNIIQPISLGGKALSYNNLLDMEGAFLCVREFTEPAGVIVKHTSPCGVAIGEDIKEAFERAYLSDPQSSFGGVVALNQPPSPELAEEFITYYFEVLLAPDFEPDVIEILKKRKNLRIVPTQNLKPPDKTFKEVLGFTLFQERDKTLSSPDEWKLVTSRKARESEIDDLFFAWKVVKYVKSNAIVLVKGKRTLGIGGGQPSRVFALEIAIQKAKTFGVETVGGVMASDAFFPFRDSIDIAKNAGITAIVTPKGSIRDKEVVQAAEEGGISLFFVEDRHFRH